MQTFGYLVYWFKDGPQCEFFWPQKMSSALERMAELRKDPLNEFVGFVSQDANRVGKDSVYRERDPAGH